MFPREEKRHKEATGSPPFDSILEGGWLFESIYTIVFVAFFAASRRLCLLFLNIVHITRCIYTYTHTALVGQKEGSMDLIARLNPFASTAAVPSVLADGCNGYAELCDRKYSDITFMASHNAAFVGKTPSHNQNEYPEQGLDMGMRYFTTQVHIEDGEIRQCHTDCALLDVGHFSEIVVSLKGWLDKNPNEVVTLLIVNGDDHVLIEEFTPIFEAAGADKIAFKPGGVLKGDDWPTLQEMIDNDERLVVFMGKLESLLPFNCSSWGSSCFTSPSNGCMTCDS